jgi:membrane-associated phospholipid phosphatase
MTAVVFLVGVSRLFLDVHYPTDVLASWAGGLFWLDVTLALVRSLAARRAPSVPLLADQSNPQSSVQ